MWFWRKKVAATKDETPKPKPREWNIPDEDLPEVLELYDNMMASIHIAIAGDAVVTTNHTAKLPKYKFWKKIREIIPNSIYLGLRVEDTKDYRCIKIVEIVKDAPLEEAEPDEQDSAEKPSEKQNG